MSITDARGTRRSRSSQGCSFATTRAPADPTDDEHDRLAPEPLVGGCSATEVAVGSFPRSRYQEPCEMVCLFVPSGAHRGVPGRRRFGDRVLVEDLAARAAATGVGFVDVNANPNAIGFYA